jgi:hypothetical protein
MDFPIVLNEPENPLLVPRKGTITDATLGKVIGHVVFHELVESAVTVFRSFTRKEK